MELLTEVIVMTLYESESEPTYPITRGGKLLKKGILVHPRNLSVGCQKLYGSNNN